MKTLGFKITVLGFALALLVACDKKPISAPGPGGGSHATPVPTIPPGPTPTPGPGPSGSGSEAPMTLESLDALEHYTGRPINNAPTNLRIVLSVRDVDTTSAKKFGGYFEIKYREGNIDRQAHFVSGLTTNEAKYNGYVTHGGAQYFKAFFEDVLGGIVVVIDQLDDLGLANGNVYFMNFRDKCTATNNPYAGWPCGTKLQLDPLTGLPIARCWSIIAGPYNCRAFVSGSNIVMNSRQFPEVSAGYRKLGRFYGLQTANAIRED